MRGHGDEAHSEQGPGERAQETHLPGVCAMPGLHRRARIHYAGLGLWTGSQPPQAARSRPRVQILAANKVLFDFEKVAFSFGPDGFGRIFMGSRIANPAAVEELLDPGTGNEKAADGSFRAPNSHFLAHAAKDGFGEAKEVAKFPVMDAIALPRDVGAPRDNGLYRGIEGEPGGGGMVVDFAGPKAEFTANAEAAGNIPNP